VNTPNSIGILNSLPSNIGQSLPRLLVSVVAAGAVLSGCASATNVSAANKPGAFTVSASATGGTVAWARAHKVALAQANDYCASRGMQTSLSAEQTTGLQAMRQHDTVIEFECHPKF
jgi:hypothetical protein